MRQRRWTIGSLVILCAVIAAGIYWFSKPHSGAVVDEAKLAGREASSFPAADEKDYLRDVDGGIELTADEVKGRNMWFVWSGGNDRFWDGITQSTFGAFDLLKVVTSHPGQKFNRDSRWSALGMVNEPCFDKPAGPDSKRFGLWLDVRRGDCAPDPFANEKKYPGVAVGARGKTVPVGSFYGDPTGIVGLRLFSNPAFNEDAAKKWDAERYYTDPAYYNDKNLIRPYRVGMSCGLCHIGPSPTNPPADPAKPAWANLNSTVGAQYMWVDRFFLPTADSDNFMFQLLHTYRPGVLDTSLISTDSINNPRTMNALYNVGARLQEGLRLGKETLAGSERNNKQFNDFVTSGPLTAFFQAPNTVFTPHILKDGSDSVGVLGALNRVYLNIGLFSEEWLLHFNAVVGGKPISPIEISVARKNSTYWQVTEATTPALALFLLKAGQPDLLKNAPGGASYLTADAAVLDRGKTVFAETCARCHSSKGPVPPASFDRSTCEGPGALACFKRYWAWTKTDDYKRQMNEIVHRPDFTDGNYLSTDARIPVTLLRTNACSPLATNAIAGNIWDNFSSQTYKNLPSVGTITVRDPFTGERKPYVMPAGGRGYTRPPSLISLWSTAPFLLNNTVGPFDQSPAVEARVKSFEASIEQMLWPEKRTKDTVLGDKGVGEIDRTTVRSSIRIPPSYVPELLTPLRGVLNRWLPRLFGEGGEITIGPIPAGLPVNLLSNIQPLADTEDLQAKVTHVKDVIALLGGLKEGLSSKGNPTDQQLNAFFAEQGPKMLKLSKCPDFEVNRGHYFGTAQFNETEGLSEDEKSFGSEPVLTDEDKRALIAYLKTF